MANANRRHRVARSMLCSGLLAAPVLIAAAPVASPASGPTSRQAVPAFTDEDSIELTAEHFGLSFRVPSDWEKREVTITSDNPDAQVFVYGPPGPLRVGRTGPVPDRRVSLFIGNRVPPGVTIEQLAAHLRESFAEQVGKPNLKFTHDAPADPVAGNPAWRLDFPTTQRVKVTFKGANGEDRGERDVDVPVNERSVFWMHDEVVAQLTYICDPSTSVSMDLLAQQILNSVKYAD